MCDRSQPVLIGSATGGGAVASMLGAFWRRGPSLSRLGGPPTAAYPAQDHRGQPPPASPNPRISAASLGLRRLLRALSPFLA